MGIINVNTNLEKMLKSLQYSLVLKLVFNLFAIGMQVIQNGEGGARKEFVVGP